MEYWIFVGRTDAETGASILWPPDAKSQFTGKDPDAGKDWGQEEKGVTEDEVVGWHHWLNGMSLSKLRKIVKDRETWSAAIHGVSESQTWQWMNNIQTVGSGAEQTSGLSRIMDNLSQDSREGLRTLATGLQSNLASVVQHWINSQRQSFGWSRKE